jgi:hypothetical protein
MAEKKELTSIKTAAQADGEKTDWKSIAEVRMLMYVIPVGIIIALISYFLSQIPR